MQYYKYCKINLQWGEYDEKGRRWDLFLINQLLPAWSPPIGKNWGIFFFSMPHTEKSCIIFQL